MRITTEIIKNLNPGKYEFDKFNKNYPNYDGTLEHFITLDKIMYYEKIWVVTKLLSKGQNIHWLVLCSLRNGISSSPIEEFIKDCLEDKDLSIACSVASKYVITEPVSEQDISQYVYYKITKTYRNDSKTQYDTLRLVEVL